MPWELPVMPIIEGGLALYKQRGLISKTGLKVLHLITKGVLRIAVFGPGGVGKSEMGRFLSASDPASVRPVDYKASRVIEDVSLHNVWGGLLIVPGQEKLFPEDWEKILGYLANGKSRIVINVVAWGYHSIAPPNGYQELKEYQTGMSDKDFLNAYLPAYRKREEEQLQILKPYLIAAEKTVRMLTLITKQDLWWPDRKAVREHYEKGTYGVTIQDIQKQREQSNKKFVHEYLPVSLVSSNFRDGRGEILAETAKGYDQNVQQAYQVGLIDVVRDYAKR